MEISKRMTYLTLTTLVIFEVASASQGVSPMMLSRNALSQSVRKMSLGNRRSTSSSSPFSSENGLYDYGYDDMVETSSLSDNIMNCNENEVQLCSATTAVGMANPFSNPIVKNLARGAFLRVASDLTGGTALENIKCRVTASDNGPFEATRALCTGGAGFWNLWSGTPARTVEGALLGAAFLVASAATKKQVMNMGAGKNIAALAGGVVGGVAQAVVMTPAGMIFTSLNVNKGKPGFENDNAITVAKRIMKEKGVQGMYIGGKPMAARQASNWASRSLLTEICRSNLQLSRFGIIGEIGSGVIGGIGSCWNTPIETVRVLMQKDVGEGRPPKTFDGYINDLTTKGGVPELYRGVSPRAVQAIWQTVFMVVVPNLLGL